MNRTKAGRVVRLRDLRVLAPILVALITATGCGGTAAAPSAVPTPRESATVGSPTQTASVVEAPVSPAPTVNVEREAWQVAEGRSLSMVCVGDGSPTVLLEAGDFAGAEMWGRLPADLGSFTRTCAYDRAGIGSSDRGTGCRDLADLTADVGALLGAAGIQGPVVLVAASGGGFISAGYAIRNPSGVAGLVFLDVPGHEFDPPPEVMADLACDNPNNPERRDFVGVEREAWKGRSQVGDIPVTIISAEYGPEAPAEDQTNAEIQKGWLVLSPSATQVLVDDGHDVLGTNYNLVLDEIRKVVTATR